LTTHYTNDPATIYPQVAETGPASPAQEPVPGALAAPGSAGPGVPAFAAREANGTPGPALATIAGHMSEATLDRNVRAIIAGLRDIGGQIAAYHTHDSRHSPSGFPDWVCAGPGGVLWRELKRESGKLTTAQLGWLQALTGAGQDAGVWRPADLCSGRITRELAALAGLRETT
jgi:hypothetical protein